MMKTIITLLVCVCLFVCTYGQSIENESNLENHFRTFCDSVLAIEKNILPGGVKNSIIMYSVDSVVVNVNNVQNVSKYAYDDNGLNISVENITYPEGSNIVQPVSYISYQYDNDNRLVGTMLKEWNMGSTQYENESLEITSYDEMGRVDSVASLKWNLSMNRWDSSYLKSVVFDSEQIVLESEFDDIEGWGIKKTKQFIYNDEGIHVETITTNHKGVFSQNKETYYRSDGMDLDSVIYSSRSDLSSEYIPFCKEVFFQESESKCITEGYGYQNNQYCLQSRSIEYLDEYGNPIDSWTEIIEGGCVVSKMTRVSAVYNHLNLLVDYKRYKWDDNSGSWQNSCWYSLPRDAFGNNIKDMIYLWDIALQEWELILMYEFEVNEIDNVIIPHWRPFYSPLFSMCVWERHYYNRTGNTMEISEDISFFYSELSVQNVPESEYNAVVVYPNPTCEVLRVSNITTPASYNIFSVTGMVCKQGFLDSSSSIYVGDLDKGCYLISFNEQSLIQKFIVR